MPNRKRPSQVPPPEIRVTRSGRTSRPARRYADEQAAQASQTRGARTASPSNEPDTADIISNVLDSVLPRDTDSGHSQEPVTQQVPASGSVQASVAQDASASGNAVEQIAQDARPANVQAPVAQDAPASGEVQAPVSQDSSTTSNAQHDGGRTSRSSSRVSSIALGDGSGGGNISTSPSSSTSTDSTVSKAPRRGRVAKTGPSNPRAKSNAPAAGNAPKAGPSNPRARSVATGGGSGTGSSSSTNATDTSQSSESEVEERRPASKIVARSKEVALASQKQSKSQNSGPYANLPSYGNGRVPVVDRRVKQKNCVYYGDLHDGIKLKRVIEVINMAKRDHRGFKIRVRFRENPNQEYDVIHDELHKFKDGEKMALKYLNRIALSTDPKEVLIYYGLLISKAKDFVVFIKGLKDNEFN